MLTINQLSAGYRGRTVARLDALVVESGQAALLLGPSGSGKSTVLMAIAGLAEVLGGAIAIDGASINPLSPSARDRLRGEKIGFIFQDLHLVAGLSALDNVLLAPFAAGAAQDKARAYDLLEDLGVGVMANRPAQKLSRGQAQRIAIARAMLMRPKLILADEPTSSLDDEACGVVADLLLRAAHETGAALLIATHDARLKARVAMQTAVERVG